MHALVIGSSLIDLFVSISDKNKVKIQDQTVTLSLGDKIPIDIKTLTLGGNGGNVSSGLKKLQVPVSFYTYLGSDVLSSHIRSVLENEGIELYIESENTVTGSLSIIFDFSSDRIIFSHHNEFPHSFNESLVTTKPDLIYLTSIGKEWTEAYTKVLEYAKAQSIPIAFSPGSQQMADINETFITTLHQSKILLCNLEEAKKINSTLSTDNIDDPKELLLNIKNNGFEVLSVTDGKNGAYAIDSQNVVYKIDAMIDDVKEKTGAGDAYAAAFLAAYMNKESIEECMKWATLNASGEMQYVGSRSGQLTLDEMRGKIKSSSFTISKL